ncbi:hypothetical protein SGLAM104S_09361 [Streptomyces glaucescens]
MVVRRRLATSPTSPWSAASSSACSLPHFARAYELADGLGLFPDPKLAEERMKTLLAMYGIRPVTGLERFSINQMTVKQLSLPELADACTGLGIRNVGLWREPVQSYGLEATAKLVSRRGPMVTTLCRGGFLTAIGPAERAAALADNRRAVDEAAALGTDTLVLVSGGLPCRLQGPARRPRAHRRRPGRTRPLRRAARRTARHRTPAP